MRSISRPQARTSAVSRKNVITFTLDKPQYLSVRRMAIYNLFCQSDGNGDLLGKKRKEDARAGLHRPKDLRWNNQIRIPDKYDGLSAPELQESRRCCWIKWRMCGSLGVAFWTILFVVLKSLILKI